jgi:plastocyanin
MFASRTAPRRLALLLVAGALAAAGCGGAGQSPTVSSPVVGPTVQAQIVDLAFTPTEVSITAGTTVNWTNTGDVAHTVTAADGSFKSEGILDPGETYEHTFGTPGTFAYVCTIHATMSGTVVVTP